MISRLSARFNARLAPLRRRLATRHLHGPKRLALADDQVMLVALMRDAAWFLPHFLEHHFALGVAHILVIDNGSRDATLSICRGYDNLTVLQNTLPAKQHEAALRAELAQNLASGGWLLFADSDELIETPVPLAQLTAWCEAQGATAVLGQMLDLWPAPGSLVQDDYRSEVARLDHYALDDLRQIDYHDRAALPFHWFLRDNLCADPKARFKQGGLRRAVFGEDPFLSKHSLVRNRAGLTVMSHPHCASGVRVADVDLLVRHYKFAGDWQARDQKALAERHWSHGEGEKRLAAIGQGGAKVPGLQRYSGIKSLQDQGFLYASAAFKAAHD